MQDKQKIRVENEFSKNFPKIADEMWTMDTYDRNFRQFDKLEICFFYFITAECKKIFSYKLQQISYNFTTKM